MPARKKKQHTARRKTKKTSKKTFARPQPKKSKKKSSKTAVKKTGAKTTARKRPSAKRAGQPMKRTKSKKSTSGDIANGLMVTLSNDAGASATIPCDERLQELAMRWRYVLSRRLRWKRSARMKMRARAHDDLINLLSSDTTRAAEVLGDGQVVEIRVPYRNERSGWEGRVAPWEFLISATASGLGNQKPLTIVRHLDTNRVPLPPLGAPKVLYVQCAPGVLAEHYEFTSERSALERLFPGAVEPCINPTIATLRHEITRRQPNVIHLAGIDNIQAKELLQDEGNLPVDWFESKEQDGIVFATEESRSTSPEVGADGQMPLGIAPIDAQTLAQVLNSGDSPLHLVMANVYHSAARICALAVAEGAGLALGFQDTVKDSLAEIFLREFYSHWHTSYDPLPAFVSALDNARASVALSGTGFVLWSAQSLLDGAVKRIRDSRESRDPDRQRMLSLDDDDGDYSKWFSVDVQIRDRLNYSLLHNDSGGLFEKLEFRKEKEGVLPDVGVEVVLYLGSESHPYSAKFTLTEFLTPVDDQIKVPLTSSIIRTVAEPVRTSLYVRITVGEKVVCQETHRVTLLPADEWKDTDADRIWLPSFVLPRDPAVELIIDRAQKHLITLADDHTRGFDGYQSIDPDDPESLADVDLQVQAIWAAVVSDFGIRYINPPPSYSRLGQRLRTPTQIVRGGRGTCIDLALLLSACLEYIEVYPVIFLLEGHAFAGYWRSEDRYNAFTEAQQKGLEDSTMLESIGSTSERSPWILPSNSYVEVLNEVNSGFLYPLETVGFTTHGSYWAAIEEGVNNLRSRSEFHSLIDIWLARSEFITPLPIVDEVVSLRGGGDHA